MLRSIVKAIPATRFYVRPTIGPHRSTFNLTVIRRPQIRTFASKKPPQWKTPIRLKYPERPLVYHAGTGRIVFIGCSKLSALFLLIFSCFFGAPTLYSLPEEPNWMVAAVIAGGAIPLLLVGSATAPFVAYVHVRLPAVARQSSEALAQWSKRIPAETEVDFTTMRLIGVPRVTRVNFAELRRKPEGGFGDISNLKVVKGRGVRGRSTNSSWRRPPAKFFTGKQSLKGKEAAIWESMLKRVSSV